MRWTLKTRLCNWDGAKRGRLRRSKNESLAQDSTMTVYLDASLFDVGATRKCESCCTSKSPDRMHLNRGIQ